MKKIFVLLALLLSIKVVFAQLPPAKPSAVAGAQVGLNNQINVTWTAPSGGVAGYKVYFKRGTNSYDSLKVGAVTSTVLNNLIYNDTYKVYLRAFRIGAAPTLDTLYSPNSDSVNVLVAGLVAPTVRQEPALNKPRSIGVIISDTNPFETGFQIEISGNGSTSTFTAPAGSNVFQEVGGLTPKTTYGVRVRAVRNGLFGPWSNQIFASTKVDLPPAATVMSDKNCPNLVHLVWTIPQRPEDIEEFIIERSYNNSSFDVLTRTAGNVRDYWDADVVPGKTAFYRIYSVNSTGITQANIHSVTIKDYVNPNPVQNIISNQNQKYDTFLTFQWTNGAEDAECGTNKRDELVVLIRKNNETEFTPYTRLPPYATSLKIDGLAPKTIVTIGIIALSDKGKTSQMITKTDTTYGPPFAPHGLIGVALINALGTPFMGISWNYNFNDHDYFKLERRAGTTGPFETIATVKNTVKNINDMKIEEGIIYYYRVKGGSYLFGEGAYSEIAGPFIYDYTKAPDAPAGLIAKVSGTKVSLKWQDESIRESANIIEKSSDNGQTYVIVASLGRNVTTYIDENVLPGKTYLYKVKASNSVGDSPYSNIAEAVIAPIGGVSNGVSVSLYPNPTTSVLNIQNISETDQQLKVTIYNKYQKNILERTLDSKSAEVKSIDMDTLEQGVYYVVISDGKNTTTKKVFKY